MSRAFVKEDAQAALPQWRKGAPGGGGDRLVLTLSGANRLKDELKRLKAAERPSNPASADAAQRIALLENVLARSDVVDARKLGGEKITFGATVVLGDTDGGARARYRIVGEIEADLKLGRISVTSPLARALIGHETGDSVQVQAPGGTRELDIEEILWLEEDASER